MNGAERIHEERDRQIREEGFDAKHDEQHEDGQLVFAACAYAAYSLGPACLFRQHAFQTGREVDFIDCWPQGWAGTWDKRGKHKATSKVRCLEVAGALIAAEIDRLLKLKEDGGKR